MPQPKYFFSVVCAVLLACGSESPGPKPPNAFTVFPNLPLPPGAEFVSRAGSADALQITLFSPTNAAEVTAYYRNVLSKGKWRLVGDAKKPDGSVVLYAEQDGPPMWVRIWPTSDKAGTMVELVGAMVGKGKDSVKLDQSGSKTAPQPTK
jgi:hypothetical protein